MTNGNNEIIIANRNGRAIRFHEAAVRVMGRTATVSYTHLADKDSFFLTFQIIPLLIQSV